MRITLKAVNDALAGMGAHTRLAKGDGYFYFDYGEAENWLDKTVSAPTLNSRTVDQWVQEYTRLKQLNRNLMQERGAAAQPRRPNARSGHDPGRSRKRRI